MLELEGHATGDPAVCAALSALVYALAGYLMSAQAGGSLHLEALELEPGRAYLHATGGGGEAYRMALIGVKELSTAYPQLVAVEEIKIMPKSGAYPPPASGTIEGEERTPGPRGGRTHKEELG